MTEREWREAIDMRSSPGTVGLVLVSAALLRFWNLGHGVVSAPEQQTIEAVLGLMRTGSYHPPALVQPALAIYLHASVASVHFLLGAARGVWASVADFGSSQVLPWGRGVSALLGTAVVFVVYQVGMRWGARHALLAAGLMAVAPTHVAASREVSAASPLTLAAAVTLLLSMEAVERGKRARLVAAGVGAGLAAAAHYAGALLLVTPLVAVWMTPDNPTPRSTRAWLVVGAAVGAFAIANPMSVRDLPAFLNGYAITASPNGMDALTASGIFRQLVWAMQWPGLILALSGLALGIVRAVSGPGHTRWTLLVSFPAVYFGAVAWHGATWNQILVPLLPSATLLAGTAVVSGVSLLRRFDIPRPARTALIAALTVLVILPPAIASIEVVREAGRERLTIARTEGQPLECVANDQLAAAMPEGLRYVESPRRDDVVAESNVAQPS